MQDLESAADFRSLWISWSYYPLIAFMHWPIVCSLQLKCGSKTVPVISKASDLQPQPAGHTHPYYIALVLENKSLVDNSNQIWRSSLQFVYYTFRKGTFLSSSRIIIFKNVNMYGFLYGLWYHILLEIII